MKIAVISDVHDNLPNLEKCLRWCVNNNIEAMVCCGDMTNNETMEYLLDNFEKPIHLVRGNADSFDEKALKKYKQLTYYGRTGRAPFLKKFIGMCHEPFHLETVLKIGKCNIVFYGHTHKPWEEDKGGVRFVNPGTLSGMFQMATFAVYDTESEELVLQILDRL